MTVKMSYCASCIYQDCYLPKRWCHVITCKVHIHSFQWKERIQLGFSWSGYMYFCYSCPSTITKNIYNSVSYQFRRWAVFNKKKLHHVTNNSSFLPAFNCHPWDLKKPQDFEANVFRVKHPWFYKPHFDSNIKLADLFSTVYEGQL